MCEERFHMITCTVAIAISKTTLEDSTADHIVRVETTCDERIAFLKQMARKNYRCFSHVCEESPEGSALCSLSTNTSRLLG